MFSVFEILVEIILTLKLKPNPLYFRTTSKTYKTQHKKDYTFDKLFNYLTIMVIIILITYV